ncbi:MAG: CocE/NonD family hydrolase [Caldilineales bacterium]|nr:CocE/NonD family hydrolase [Caldilineales bacterium]
MGLIIALAALILVVATLYFLRRPLLAVVLRLPPPRNGVRVQRNIPIIMPDGVRLFADLYSPKAEGSHPAILIRTPYGRRKEVFLGGGMAMNELPGQRFAERGYNVLVQSVRGRYAAEGEFSPHVNELADGAATVAWVRQQPWFNGVLATWGPSYLGYTQWAVAASDPTGLQAMLPTLTSAENFSVTHPDGAFGLETRLRWCQGLANTGRQDSDRGGMRDAEDRLQTAFGHLPLLEADIAAVDEPIPYYREMLVNARAEDEYWVQRDHSGRVAEVTAAVHFVGGWHDYYLRGLLRDYAALVGAGRKPYLIIGPWHHASMGGLLAGLREGIAWFDAQLLGREGLRAQPVRIFVGGAEEWREMDAFPPPAVETRFFLHEDGDLSLASPAQDSTPDHYRYDPAAPTPGLGGAILGMKGAGVQDNRPLLARADVLSYVSAPLEKDVECIGSVRMTLFVRSSLAHTDFFARLCDLRPDGKLLNVCDGLFRIKPGLGEPQEDGSLRIEIDMWATAHRFRQGHRLAVLIASGAHPRWNRNLGTGEPDATSTAMAVAEQTIYHDASHPSALILPVV